MAPKQEGESLEYKLMFELERLESVREDMEEMGVKSLAEVEARIAELHQRLDEMVREE